MRTLKTKLLNAIHAETLDKCGNFLRYVLSRFNDDRLFESAGSLSYTSILAVVPFAAVIFAVLTAFPVFDEGTQKLTDFVFANFVPSVATNLESAVRAFADSARSLPTIGLFALAVTVLLTMWSVEKAFNRIWRVPASKPKLFRFMIYWGVLSFGSLSLVSLLALNSILSVYFNIAQYTPPVLNAIGLWLAPLVLEFIGFTAAYGFIPHCKVSFRIAAIGGLLATLLFELLKWLFGIYLASVSFQQIYGALAVVPIALVWLYFVWVVILFCASITAILSSFRYRPKAVRNAKGVDFYWVLRILARFEQAEKSKISLRFEQLTLLEKHIPDAILNNYLYQLREIGVLCAEANSVWSLSETAHAISLFELHKQMALRIPSCASEIPFQSDEIDSQIKPILIRLQQSQQTLLNTKICEIYE